MRNFKDFSTNIKLLRSVYKLSGQNMCDLLRLNSSAIVTFWEQGRNFPSADTLCSIAEIFCISLDWFFGLEEQKKCYGATIIKWREELFIDAALQKYDTGSKYCALMDLSLMIKNHYSTVKQREKYSLPVRANLCYLFYCYVMYSGQLKALETDIAAYPAELGKDAKIDAQIQGLKQIKKITNKKEQIENYIKQLLSPDAKPLFDLTKV